MNPKAPLARKDSLIVKDLPEETLVYDTTTDKAHCLNDTAATIWKSCDGKNSVGQIAQRLGSKLGKPVNENVVWLALDQLEKFKLLEQPVDKPAFLSSLSRRQVVRALGIAAIVAPIVTSIVVPTAAQGGPSIPPGFCCVSPNDCLPGSTCEQEGPTDPPCTVYPPNPQNSGKFCT